MDILWAPWREQYVAKTGKRKGPCVFCAILRMKEDTKHYILFRTRHSFAVLNIHPFNAGHTLVLPLRHVDDMDKLTKIERADLMETLLRVKRLIEKELKPQAFNIGMNTGHESGAGIPKHMHFHVVPRWTGDINFMPVVFGTKVIPVSLRKVYKVLKHAHKS